MKPEPHRVGGMVFFLLWLVSCSSEPGGIVILCAGDSITEAEYPRLLRRLLTQEGYRVQVHNYGRKGNNSREYLKFLEEREKGLAGLQPDFVLLELGTNDVRGDNDFTPVAEFDRTMRKIIGIFERFSTRKGKKPQILLATVPPLPENLPPPFVRESAVRVVEEINPVLKKIASDYQLVLVDNYSLFLENPELLPGIHPTSMGYRLLAQNWLRHLRPFLPKQRKASRGHFIGDF